MAAVTLSGFNGIDFNTIINAVMTQESQPLTDLQNQQALMKNRDSAMVSLGGLIANLQTPVTALTNASSFSNVAASSTDTSIGTVSLGDGGIPGQYDLVVDHLAKGQVTASANGYTATSSTVATSGTISFTIDGETTDDITISSDTTLASLREQINNQDSGVVASIVHDGTNYKLVISSRETGLSNGFTINNSLANTAGTVVSFGANSQDAINAAFTVNGLDISSGSNTVTEAIPGITVNLLKAGSMSVKVTTDYSSLKDNLKSIVAQYNKLRQFQAQQKAGALGNDSVVREAVNDVKSILLTSNGNGGRYHYLSEIGLEVTATGDLKLDETKLNTAINSYPSDLQKLFQGTDTVDGALESMKSILSNLDATAGLVKTTRDSLDTSLKAMTDRIASQQLRLDIRRKELVKTYSAADQAMSQLKSQSTSLSNLGSSTF